MIMYFQENTPEYTAYQRGYQAGLDAQKESDVALIKQKRDELVTKRNNIDEKHEHFVAAYRELTLQINLLYGLLKEIGEA